MKLTIVYQNGTTLEQHVHWARVNDERMLSFATKKNPTPSVPHIVSIPLANIDTFAVTES
jgi:hypothetical protein